jgi:hypothetical protein
MEYDAIDWDQAWSAVVDPVVEAWRNDRLTNAIEDKYHRWYVESAPCRLYAERLLANLRNANSGLQFAAHTDATGWPANAYWRLLARMPNGKPLLAKKLKKLQRAAKAILRNIEKKYPDIGTTTQHEARLAAEKRIKEDLKRHGLGVRLSHEQPTETPRRGCLLSILTLFAPFGGS